MQRDFFHPLPGWQFHRWEEGRRVFRKVDREFGLVERELFPGFVLVEDHIGVKEWDGRVFRKVVCVRRVGWRLGPPDAPVQWH